ncbi:MAG: hypothetical protein ACK5GU_09620, partial [Chloroflexota bacterium]
TKTAYGNTLVSSLYLQPVGATIRTGITDTMPITDEALNTLRQISSVIPDKYRSQLLAETGNNYAPGAKFVFYTDTAGVGLEHAIILAAGTGS